jgi:hypothetical protein
LVLKVGLVSNEEKDCIFFSICLNFVHPELADVFETQWIGEVEDEKDSLAASVVGAGDRSKTFLASSVPDLEFHIFLINFDGLEAKVDSDCS